MIIAKRPRRYAIPCGRRASRQNCRAQQVFLQRSMQIVTRNWPRLMLCLARHCYRKPLLQRCWAEAPVKIARMTLTAKLDGNWSSFQLANNTPPLSVTGSVIAPSARIFSKASAAQQARALDVARVFVAVAARFTKRARACARAFPVHGACNHHGAPCGVIVGNPGFPQKFVKSH